VGDRIFFDTDSSVIRADAHQTLSKQAQWLNQYGNYAITVEGHADERGTREYNLALGARRAAATRDFLIGRGVASKRIRTISYGKERPVAVCNDISCWSQNRRAVTVLDGAGTEPGGKFAIPLILSFSPTGRRNVVEMSTATSALKFVAAMPLASLLP